MRRRPALLVALVGIGLTVSIALVATGDDDRSPSAATGATAADPATATTHPPPAGAPPVDRARR